MNNNLVRYNEESVEIVQYPENMEGIISSMADRFSAKRPELEKRLNEWNKTAGCLPKGGPQKDL